MKDIFLEIIEFIINTTKEIWETVSNLIDIKKTVIILPPGIIGLIILFKKIKK